MLASRERCRVWRVRILEVRYQAVPYISRWRSCQYLLFPTSGGGALASWYTAASDLPATAAFLVRVPHDQREAGADLGVFSARPAPIGAAVSTQRA